MESTDCREQKGPFFYDVACTLELSGSDGDPISLVFTTDNREVKVAYDEGMKDWGRVVALQYNTTNPVSGGLDQGVDTQPRAAVSVRKSRA